MAATNATHWHSRLGLRIAASAAILSLTPRAAFAGMPALRFNEVIQPRFEVISFFLVVLVLSSAAVYSLWNWLRSDFTRLPRLTFAKACGIVTLWGLLFVVVLTMISGARELMTPGAWERDGATYKLQDVDTDRTSDPQNFALRRQKLDALAAALAAFTAKHEGRFPNTDELSDLSADLLQVPGIPGLKYAYVPGRVKYGNAQLLAFEPASYGDEPLALFTTGEVRQINSAEIEQLRTTGVP